MNAIRLDYFPRARKVRTCRQPPHRDYGQDWCVICRREFTRNCGTQKLCGREECRKEYQRRDWQKRKAAGYGLSGKRSPGPLVPALPPPICGCGEKLGFSSDPMSGVSTEYCPTCGERKLQLYGVRGATQEK